MDKTDNAYLINIFQENKINLSTHQYNPDTSTKYRIGHNTKFNPNPQNFIYRDIDICKEI